MTKSLTAMDVCNKDQGIVTYVLKLAIIFVFHIYFIG